MIKKKRAAVIAVIIIGIIGIIFIVIFQRTPSLRTYIPTMDQSEEDRVYFQSLVDGIRSGGPPKDGIPAIDRPQYESLAEADMWLQPNDIVFGVVFKDRTIAYPQRILVWHEIVNETFDGKPVSITYCPLTGTAIGFKSHSPESRNPTLGVSGKLVNSNLIMYDRESDSLWPQILGQAILGPETGNQLQEFPVTWTTWERWKRKFPNSQVLSRKTGFLRNYSVSGDPYGSYHSDSGYYVNRSIIFSPVYASEALHPKEVVIGIRDEKRNAIAIVKDALREQKQMEVPLGDRMVSIEYDEELDFYNATYVDTGEWINSFDAMWFAWYGFYPQTELIK